MPPTPRASSSNEAALLLKLEQLTGGIDPEKSDETWVESLVVTAPEPLQLDDPDDDLKRELAFYNQALSAVRVAQERLDRLGIPHVRPDDYFAEMVKTDKHMNKVKMRMLREQTDIAAAEERRKQSANKKFGKQVQHEVLQARQQEKRRNMVEVKELRKKRKGAGRKPGRPYRRLTDEVLGVRKDTLDKKLQVLVARRTLLEDRLKAYEQEVAARAEEGPAA